MKMLRKVKTSMMNIVQNEHRKIIENYNSPKKYLKDGDNNLFYKFTRSQQQDWKQGQSPDTKCHQYHPPTFSLTIKIFSTFIRILSIFW